MKRVYNKLGEEVYDHKNSNDWYCPRFFDHVYTHTNGHYAACCIADSTSTPRIDQANPSEWFHSDYMDNLRRASLNPKAKGSKEILYESCYRCMNQERDYSTSYRMESVASLEDADEVLRATKIYQQKGKATLLPNLLSVQLRMFGNTCNLDCYMCQPQGSSIRERTIKDNNYREHVAFDRDMYIKPKFTVDMLDGIDEISMSIRTILLQGGEPLYIKNQFKMLDRLIELGVSKNISIEMNSNMTILGVSNLNIMDYLDEFKGLSVQASIDGYGKYNDYIRRRSKWKDVTSNIETMRRKSKVSMSIFSTFSLLSLLRFDLLQDWALKEDLEISTFIVDDPPELNPRHLPDPIKEELMYKHSDDRNIVECLRRDRDPKSFVNALNYIIKTDKIYGTDVFELYPELKPYYDEECK